MPPLGHGEHNYIFILYALSEELKVRPGLTKQRLLKLIGEHVIATATLIGTYERKSELKGPDHHSQYSREYIAETARLQSHSPFDKLH